MKNLLKITAAVIVPAMMMAVTLPSASAESSRSKTSTSHRAAMNPQQFAQRAAISDAFELESSRLAVQRARNPEVKSFAQHMIDDHTKSTTELSSIMPNLGTTATAQSGSSQGRTAAGNSGTGVRGGSAAGNTDTTGATASGSAASGQSGVMLDQKHAQMLSRLRNASDSEFDRLYVQDQVKAHEEALAMFRAYSRSGRNAELKSFASETLPTLVEHERNARQLQSSVRRTS